MGEYCLTGIYQRYILIGINVSKECSMNYQPKTLVVAVIGATIAILGVTLIHDRYFAAAFAVLCYFLAVRIMDSLGEAQ
jgi:hypothetical protein